MIARADDRANLRVGGDRRARRTAGVGGSLSLELPPRWRSLVRGGMELGHAMDAVTGEHDVKRGVGAVGVLTAGLVTRQAAPTRRWWRTRWCRC